MVKAAAIKTSAPGSLMLLGEHAVLHGHHALVGAIDRRITVELFPAEDECLEIHSALGHYHAPLDDLIEHPSFRFVIDIVQRHRDLLSGGLRLNIESEFSADIGFGSSAAVTVATHAALMHWIDGKAPKPDILFRYALETVHRVQGRGSGADLAASVFGGCVAYKTTPEFVPVEISMPLTAVYCGYKTPTAEVIGKVEQLRAEDPEKYDGIYHEIDEAVADAIQCLLMHDLPGFGRILNHNQILMERMGVNTPELEEIVFAMHSDAEIFGAKISGSGLGDCAVGIGYADLDELDYPVYHLQITPAGCLYHA